MRIELIIFDWGGTLCSVANQSEALLRGAFKVTRVLGSNSDGHIVNTLVAEAMQAEHRAAADPEHREVDLHAFLADWAERNGRDVDVDRIAEAVDAIGKYWIGGALELIPGAIEAVRCLRERGYKLGLLSNVWIPPQFCRKELARQGLAELLDFAVFSSGIGFRKPAEVIYEAALQAAYPQGRPADLSHVLFVGDSPSCDIMAPAKLGMKTALVDDVAGMWPEAEHEAAKPDWRIKAVAELPDLLAEL